MSWREAVGWALVAAGALCGVGAAWMKSGISDALIAASGAFSAAAAMWGYQNKPPAAPK
jgi:hypothetical protein